MNNLSYLYDLFFYDEAIKNSKNVYIITDGVFNGFPFHALFDSSSNEWVIDKANIKYLSSEKLFMHINNNKLSTRKKFLGFGNPALNKKGLSNEVQKFFSERGDFNIENIIDLYELPESEKEIIGISSFFKNKEIFVQSDATEKNLAKALDKNSGYDFIAFATHSLKGVDKFSNDRGLVLTPINENSYDQDGFLSTAEIKNLNLTNDPVIILTACNIIDSQYHESLPFTGITSSFMTAGASSVMLSLWNVDSKSSAILNQSIFTKKNNNKDFSRSMRESVLFLKSQETYKHPYYWAPYIYFGR
jgi:CHAT domain-containing protein